MKTIFENGSAYSGDCLKTLRLLPGESVDSVIMSPPYWQLRDYNFDGQWGMEADFNEYLDKMIELMKELKRVLKPKGTMWINLGDTYSTFRGKSGQSPDQQEKEKNRGIVKNTRSKHHLDRPGKNKYDKSLLLIPHRFAIRCMDELDLILRNDIIWAKQNGMPESVTDRFTKKHEFIFFFTKQTDYYFDLDSIREKHSPSTIIRNQYSKVAYGEGFAKVTPWKPGDFAHPNGKNPGDVSDFWNVKPGKGSSNHFATYNIELIKKPVLAGSPVNGVILDPFAGTGTTAIAAIEYDRKFIMIEGNMEYYQSMCQNIRAHTAQLKINFQEVN